MTKQCYSKRGVTIHDLKSKIDRNSPSISTTEIKCGLDDPQPSATDNCANRDAMVC